MIAMWIVAALALAWLLAVAPNWKHRRARAWRGTRFAHRGLHDAVAPENSMAAFDRAVAAGVGVELDVQLTSDGVPVVFHDWTLDRMCGVSGRIGQKTFAELQELRLGGTGERIPALQAVLERVDGRVPLLVEIKSQGLDGKAAAGAWSKLKAYRGAYIVESFNPLALFWYRMHAPQVIRGQLVSSCADLCASAGSIGAWFLSSLVLNFVGRPDFIARRYDVRYGLSNRAMRAIFRPQLAAWTVRDVHEERDLVKKGEISIFERCGSQTASRE